MEFSIQVNPEFDIRTLFKAVCQFLGEIDHNQQIQLNAQAEKAQQELKQRWGTLSIFELEILKEAANPIRGDTLEVKYRTQVQPILDRYEPLGPKPKLIRLGRGHYEDELTSEDRTRLALIQQFIKVTQDFVSIKVIHKIVCEPYCSKCGHVFDQNSGESQNVCPECNLFQVITYRRSHQDLDDGVTSKEEDSQDLKNYLENVMAYQGLNRPNFPSDFYPRLNQFLKSKHYPVREDIQKNPKKYPLQKDLTRKGTSRDVMYAAIKASCSSPAKFYKYINVVCHEVWDWGLPRFEDLIPILKEDYQVSQPVYSRVVAGKKKSSLNAQMRLFVDLYRYRDRLSFELKSTNFKIPDTTSIRDENIRAWNATCKQLDWDSPFMSRPQTISLGKKKNAN